MDNPQPIPLSDAQLAEMLDEIVKSGRIEMMDAVLIVEAAERLKLRPVPLHGAVEPERGTELNGNRDAKRQSGEICRDATHAPRSKSYATTSSAKMVAERKGNSPLRTQPRVS